ncbi:hypothetical protein ABZP36_007823 [Zizania latifolia]
MARNEEERRHGRLPSASARVEPDKADVAPIQTRDCETESVRFAGLCIVEENCANVCRTEGFSGGRCSTFARNCICIKPC